MTEREFVAKNEMKWWSQNDYNGSDKLFIDKKNYSYIGFHYQSVLTKMIASLWEFPVEVSCFFRSYK